MTSNRLTLFALSGEILILLWLIWLVAGVLIYVFSRRHTRPEYSKSDYPDKTDWVKPKNL